MKRIPSNVVTALDIRREGDLRMPITEVTQLTKSELETMTVGSYRVYRLPSAHLLSNAKDCAWAYSTRHLRDIGQRLIMSAHESAERPGTYLLYVVRVDYKMAPLKNRTGHA